MLRILFIQKNGEIAGEKVEILWKRLASSQKKNFSLEGGVLLISRMFIGEYRYTIDNKKRLALPAKFRKELGKTVIITRGLENCLVIYPLREWKITAEKLSKLPSSRLDARGFARVMLAGACDASLDKLGRVLIPDYLKKYAFLNKNVILLGLSNRIEVWDENRWQKYREKTEDEIGNIAERLEQLGI